MAAEGATFQKVLADTRHRLALHHLKGAERSMDEIALLLGYQDTPSFVRAFRHWTGMPPASYRKSLTD